MSANIERSGQPADGGKVWWAELFPDEFKRRLAECPVVYLPLGMNEPHGQISAMGLDTIKAEYLCVRAAQQYGGIVAPSLGYNIHETGGYAKWLEREIGEHNPHMTSIPPYVYLHFLLYQLRAFANAGFRAAIVLSGHAGGNQRDFRRAAEAFMSRVPMAVWAGTDGELAHPEFAGDHAGKFELSQLMAIRPDLVDRARGKLAAAEGSGGSYALGADADEASPAYGERILQACLRQLGAVVRQQLAAGERHRGETGIVSYETVERIWRELLDSAEEWDTLRPRAGQEAVAPHSRWQLYERPDPALYRRDDTDGGR